jgi:hypothetical protein
MGDELRSGFDAKWHDTFARLSPGGRRLSRWDAARYKARIEEANPGWRVEVYDEDSGFTSLYVFMASTPRHAGWWIFTERQAEECLT